MEKVIVTPRSISSADNPKLLPLREAGYECVFPNPGKSPSEADLLAVIGDAVGYVAGVEKIGGAVLRAAGKLRAISRNGTGVDNVDTVEAERLGITVLRAEGANARGVAELALASMLSAARFLPEHDANLKKEAWERRKGFELEGKTLGLVGCGKIGKLVAGFAAALGMRIVAYDPFPDRSFDAGGALRYADLDEAVVSAHVVSLHCPPPKDGSPLLDRSRISRMRKGAVIVNTARAELWDEREILAALDDGRLSAVTVDAFAKEPPDDWRFVRHPRVIATPHIGAFTDESVERATEAAVSNLISALRAGK